MVPSNPHDLRPVSPFRLLLHGGDWCRLGRESKFRPTRTPGKKLRIEVTAKFPTNAGAWPAIWTVGLDVCSLIILAEQLGC